MKDVKLNDLKKAGKELNALLFDPKDADQIDVKLGAAELSTAILEASELLTDDDDEDLTPLVKNVIAALKENAEEAGAEEEENEEEENEEETEEEEESEEEEALSLKEQIEEAITISDLKEIIKNNEEFASLRKTVKGKFNLDDLVSEMMAIIEPKKAKTTGKKETVKEPVKETKKEVAPVAKKETAKTTPAKAEKPKKIVGAAKVTTADRIAFIAPFIAKAKYNKKELLEMMVEKWPDMPIGGHQVILTDCKNPKYNKFEKLVVSNEVGVFSFKK